MRYYLSRWFKRPKIWTKYVNYLGFEDGKYACANCDRNTKPQDLSWIGHFCHACLLKDRVEWLDWRFTGDSQKLPKKV